MYTMLYYFIMSVFCFLYSSVHAFMYKMATFCDISTCVEYLSNTLVNLDWGILNRFLNIIAINPPIKTLLSKHSNQNTPFRNIAACILEFLQISKNQSWFLHPRLAGSKINYLYMMHQIQCIILKLDSNTYSCWFHNGAKFLAYDHCVEFLV